MAIKYQSQLKNIQLCALVKQNVMSKYGMNECLKPLVEDIKKLLSFLFCCSQYTIQCTLFYFLLLILFRKMDLMLILVVQVTILLVPFVLCKQKTQPAVEWVGSRRALQLSGLADNV